MIRRSIFKGFASDQRWSDQESSRAGFEKGRIDPCETEEVREDLRSAASDFSRRSHKRKLKGCCRWRRCACTDARSRLDEHHRINRRIEHDFLLVNGDGAAARFDLDVSR